MSNDRKIAVAILNQAAKLVGKERVTHGSVVESFTMIADLWSTYINNVTAHRSGVGGPFPPVHLDARDVLNMMADVKKVRSVYGDNHAIDNYVDGAGYISLAGMLMTDILIHEEKITEETTEEPPPPTPEEAPIPSFLKKVK